MSDRMFLSMKLVLLLRVIILLLIIGDISGLRSLCIQYILRTVLGVVKVQLISYEFVIVLWGRNYYWFYFIDSLIEVLKV